MGKDGGPMTAKAVAKRIKAKGLGRLRWYCQMCEKQCRDENGFKCHTQSAVHQRKLAVFTERPEEFISKFSTQFRRDFLLVLRRRYGTSLVLANNVYQEYIKDRDHLHMNATKWTTLTEFVKELGRDGLCRVEDRDDGWWLAYLDRDAAEKHRMAREIDGARLDEEQRADVLLQRQLRAARAQQSVAEGENDDERLAAVNEGPIAMRLESQRKRRMVAVADGNVLNTMGADGVKTKKRKRNRWGEAAKVSAIEEIMRSEQEASKEEEGKVEVDSRPWVHENIVVKILNKEVGDGRFYGKKGKVIKVIEEYGAQVKLVDGETTVELDQDDLETVIPKVGGTVMFVRGARRGRKGKIKSIHTEAFCVTVAEEGSGEQVSRVEYEDVSRAV